jgi:hypothetical protein
MNSIDEEIARAEANIKICEDNVNKFIVEKSRAEAELENLKRKKKANENRKIKTRSLQLASNLLDIAIQREDDDDVAKACWLAIDKIKSVIDILNITSL